MPETFREFSIRSFRELQQSPEWDQLGEMSMTDLLDMIENEFYDCAEDPVLPIAEPDDRAGSMLQ